MPQTRKEFIHQSALITAAFLAGSALDSPKRKPLLSFSTLGCPDWDFKKIAKFARRNDYDGLEIRGIKRQLDLPKCPEFSTSQNIADTVRFVRRNNLKFVCLGTSANLHFRDGADRKKNLDDARRFIDLAKELNCPFVRVFPNIFPKDQDKQATIDLIAKGLLELGEYCKGSNTSVLMETHGELVKMDDLEKIMQSATHPHTGLVWDVCNMWMITQESTVDVYRRLQKWIRHTHIKDAKKVDDKIQYTPFSQRGEVPIFDAIDTLYRSGYEGYYSFEWEKLWHPELAEPEEVLAEYSKGMRHHFNYLRRK